LDEVEELTRPGAGEDREKPADSYDAANDQLANIVPSDEDDGNDP
jgi:hypothetical protein